MKVSSDKKKSLHFFHNFMVQNFAAFKFYFLCMQRRKQHLTFLPNYKDKY